MSLDEVTSDYYVEYVFVEYVLATFLRTEGKTLIVFGKELRSLTSGTRLWRALRSTLTSSLGASRLRLAISRAVASEAIKPNAVANFYNVYILSTQTAGKGAVKCLTFLSAVAEVFSAQWGVFGPIKTIVSQHQFGAYIWAA